MGRGRSGGNELARGVCVGVVSVCVCVWGLFQVGLLCSGVVGRCRMDGAGAFVGEGIGLVACEGRGACTRLAEGRGACVCGWLPVRDGGRVWVFACEGRGACAGVCL